MARPGPTKRQGLTRLLDALDTVSTALAWLAMALIVVLVASMIFEVVSRRVFNRPTLWAQDIATMANGVLFVASGAFILRTRSHIRIDFLSSRFNPTVRLVIDAVFFAAVLVPVLAVIGHASASEALEAYLTDRVEWVSPWKPLMWPYLSGIALGVWALCLQAAIEAVRCLLEIGELRAGATAERSALRPGEAHAGGGR